jgi:hypothetical protein
VASKSIPILFVDTDGVEPTWGYPPFYERRDLDGGSKLLRNKLTATAGDTKT